MPSVTGSPSTTPAQIPAVGNKQPPIAGVVATLVNSPNPVVAGVGEVLQVVLAAAVMPPAVKPILVQHGSRVMALGRKRMSALNGRNAMIYLKSKFGLLSAARPVIMDASFIGKEDEFVEVDMDAWEELVPQIAKLNLYVEA